MNWGLLCLSHCWFPGFGRRWLAWHDQVPWSKDLLRGLDQKDLADWMWVVFCQFVIFSFGTFWWHFRVPCSSCLFFFCKGVSTLIAILWGLCWLDREKKKHNKLMDKFQHLLIWRPIHYNYAFTTFPTCGGILFINNFKDSARCVPFFL